MKTHQLLVLFAAGAAAFQLAPNSQAQNSSVSYTGGTYGQNFDTLPTTTTDVNTSNPVTIGSTTYGFNSSAYTSNTSTAAPGTANGSFDFAAPVSAAPSATGASGLGLSSMAGWYGGATAGIKVGAQSGSQTTGGVISFGAPGSTNRALGLLNTSSTGVSFFGLKLINSTLAPITSISFGFTGELWRQGTSTTDPTKVISFGYYVDPTLSDGIPTTTTAIDSFGEPASTTENMSNTAPLATSQVLENGITLTTPWTAGSALWLVFQMTDPGSQSQGLVIDGFVFSDLPVPEPSTWTMLAAGAAGLLAFAWRRSRGVAAAR